MSLQILQAREQRWQHKLALAERYSETIVSLALNIPGPDKHLYGVQEAFTALEHALHTIIDKLPAGALLHDSAPQLSADGPYLLLAVKTAPLTLKRQLAELEETHPLGRLADLDVYSKAFGPVSRSDINLPPRSCFLCGNEAAICRRTQTHSAEEIIAFARNLLTQAVNTYSNTGGN